MQIITVSDVAKAAGVSTATVSRVLNDSKLVTESKRRRVSQVMQELGYVPQNRTGKKTPGNQIILLVSSVFPVLEEICAGINAAIRELDAPWELAICYAGDDYKNALSLMKLIPQDLLRGLIFFNNFCTDRELWEEFQRYPLVRIGEYSDNDPSFVISTDDFKAMSDMTGLLIRKGRRRFALVSNNFFAEQQRYYFCMRREAGFRAALREAGLPFDERMLLYVDYTVEGGLDAARRIAEMRPLPDAVVCVNDFIATGCVIGLGELGIQIPGGMAVTGFDGMEVAEFCRPKLTTVRQAFEEMGMEALRMLDTLSMGRLGAGRITFIAHSIIEREST
jgi:LacI family repressor for deo operon, udp, cdd, tsx, nupC, and nupG